MASRRFFDRLRRRGLRGAPGRAALDLAPDLHERDEARLRAVIADLLRMHDTMTQRAEAAAVADAYVALSDDGRRNFHLLLARDFWTDPQAVDDAVADLTASRDRRAAERRLRDALVPPADRLLQLLSGLEGGVKFLVDLRADVLRMDVPRAGDADAGLADLDRELKAHITTLFDVGLLALRRITWEAPAALLEKLINYEAVHAISSWDDLKNRLDSDRRCYAFFHPAMPDEPLVFVEIALTAGMATELAPLLDARAPELDLERADTAVFYSISNCQPGLAGVNLGTALIKQVVEALRVDLPQLRRFVTLSPIPGFRAWVESQLGDRARLGERELALLPAEPARMLERLSAAEWDADEAVRPALLAMCARYLTTTRDGRAPDPVANFHLSNGATIERIDWMADATPKGREQSFGVMANYLYEPDRIPERAEAYATKGEIPMAAEVRELAG
ncbi:MAG TPA: malonyl-CoA decarboxylase family protein [Acidimicrobiia bacterium]|nr:malonyl-CoA decarboxylase family protein [Acidimicrobiia bacterium]